MKQSTVLAAAICAAALVTATAANAVIVDVSATTGIAATTLLQPGTYSLSWIDNTANGGFAAWSARVPNTQWREAVSISVGSNSITVDKYSSAGSYYKEFSSPAAALAAFQSGPFAVFVNGSTTASPVQTPQFTLNAPTSVSFSIPDSANALWDNAGGVSLSVAAVPEPATYALMFAGLGGVGAVARRRKQQPAA